MSRVSSIEPLTLSDELARIAPGMSWRELSSWPPDVFAATSTILGDSGAYRSVVCPPEGRSWPPSADVTGGSAWETSVPRLGREWAAWVTARSAAESDARPDPPEIVARLGSILDGAGRAPVMDLDDSEHWQMTAALLTLHAMADEACAGVGLRTATEFQLMAMALLEETGSLSRLPVDRVRVLPKLRPPDSGITLRSISHNLAFDRSEVRTNWVRVPEPTGDAMTAAARAAHVAARALSVQRPRQRLPPHPRPAPEHGRGAVWLLRVRTHRTARPRRHRGPGRGGASSCRRHRRRRATGGSPRRISGAGGPGAGGRGRGPVPDHGRAPLSDEGGALRHQLRVHRRHVAGTHPSTNTIAGAWTRRRSTSTTSAPRSTPTIAGGRRSASSDAA